MSALKLIVAVISGDYNIVTIYIEFYIMVFEISHAVRSDDALIVYRIERQ